MRRSGLAAALSLFLLPLQVDAETQRERTFAICLTITPGLGAASLGHPGRGALNFALYSSGMGLVATGLSEVDKKGNPNSGMVTLGGVAVAGSFIWAFVDGATLEASEDFTYVRPLPRDWRPGSDPVRPVNTPAPMPSATPAAIATPSGVATPAPAAAPTPEPTPKPPEPHVSDPSGSAFIKTQSAGLQQVEVGRYVRAIRTDGTEVTGAIREVSSVAILIEAANGTTVLIRGTELRQVQAARKP